MRLNPAPSALWTRGQRPPAAFPLGRRLPPHHADLEAILPPPCLLQQRPALEHHPDRICHRPAALPPDGWLNSYPPLPEEPRCLRPSDPKAKPRPSRQRDTLPASHPNRGPLRPDPRPPGCMTRPPCVIQPKARTRESAHHCPDQEAAAVPPPHPRPPTVPAPTTRTHAPSSSPNAEPPPLPRPSRCSSPDPALTWPTWLSSYPPPAAVTPCRARPENGTQPPGLHPAKRTNTRTTGGRARRFLVCGRRIRLDRRADPGTSPAHSPASQRPSPDRPPSAQPHPTCPAERNGLINRRRGWAEKRKGVAADRTAVPPPVLSTRSRPHTTPSLAPPALPAPARPPSSPLDAFLLRIRTEGCPTPSLRPPAQMPFARSLRPEARIRTTA